MTDQPIDDAAVQARSLVDLLRQRGLTAATAESLTGGLVAVAITAVPGASAVFRGGVVAYATDSKVSVLGVPAEVLAQHGPVAEVTAVRMAQAVCALFAADVGIATTGVAGPDPVADLLPGVVFVAAALRSGPVLVRRPDCHGTRPAIRAAAVRAALATGRDLLETGRTDRE